VPWPSDCVMKAMGRTYADIVAKHRADRVEDGECVASVPAVVLQYDAPPIEAQIASNRAQASARYA
jgi:hypothetical protein